MHQIALREVWTQHDSSREAVQDSSPLKIFMSPWLVVVGITDVGTQGVTLFVESLKKSEEV
jgi:hypothetical protein